MFFYILDCSRLVLDLYNYSFIEINILYSLDNRANKGIFVCICKTHQVLSIITYNAFFYISVEMMFKFSRR